MAVWRRGLAVVRRAWTLLQQAVGKAREDELALQSAGLAFVTMVSLVPLLAAVSYLGTRAFPDEGRLVEILATLLPYSEATLLEKLREVVAQARTLRGWGVVAFFATSLIAFVHVERTLNRIWRVGEGRPLRIRLRSFTLVLFWGPPIIAATYASLFLLGQQAAIEAVTRRLSLQLVPFGLTFVGLAMLYYLVPFTAVRLRSAALGALVASILLAGLRHGFGFYVDLAQHVSVLYGSLGFLLFFMLSIQLAWWTVLLGGEVAYCVERGAQALAPGRQGTARDGGWLGLVALVSIVERFRAGQPIMPRGELAVRLGLDERALDAALVPLHEVGLIAPSSDGQGVLLATDPYQLPVSDVLGAYDEANRVRLTGLSPEVRDQLAPLHVRLTEARDGIAAMTLAELLGAAPSE